MRLNPRWHVRIDGLEHLAKGPYVIVSNHMSQMDVLVMNFVRHHYKWIAKREAFSIPVIGWCMWYARYIPLVRGNAQSHVRCLARATEWARRGVSVWFFPEGTRSADGEVKRFKLGAFRVAAQSGAKILPVTITGTREVLPKGSGRFAARARILIRIDAPFAPPNSEELEACADRVRQHIAGRKQEMESPSEFVK